MINTATVPMLHDCIDSLKNTSRDDSGDRIEFMVDSSLAVIDFDKAKDLYIEGLKRPPSEKPKSADALFSGNRGKYFIEFKNGKLDKKKALEVHQKALDSVLVLGDLTKSVLSDFREECEFILVYNGEKNVSGLSGSSSPNTGYQSSASRAYIAGAVSRKAGWRFVQYGIEPLRHYCFKDVHACTVEEFKKNYIDVWEKEQGI